MTRSGWLETLDPSQLGQFVNLGKIIEADGKRKMTNLMFSCDVPPHDEENCSTNEAELNGAGEKERCTVLNQLEKIMGVRQIGQTVLR